MYKSLGTKNKFLNSIWMWCQYNTRLILYMGAKSKFPQILTYDTFLESLGEDLSNPAYIGLIPRVILTLHPKIGLISAETLTLHPNIGLICCYFDTTSK